MTTILPPLPRIMHLSARAIGVLLAGALLLVALVAVRAQIEGDRGIQPRAQSTDIEVGGIEVDVTADTAQEAREKGWTEAARLAWEKLEGPQISDGQLNSMVAGILIERESIGPKRYIATLGVVFDRQRAGGMLGQGSQAKRSAPMLMLPVLNEGGVYTMFESRTEWQRAWAEANFGSSPVDYVRPSGAGGESLLLTYGQTGRRSRVWWRNILDQFGASDVLVAIAEVTRRYPGGPVEANFVARYGPNNAYLGSFRLKAANDAAIPAMYEQAVARFDRIYSRALADGKLSPDPTLGRQSLSLSPEWRAALDQLRAKNQAQADASSGASRSSSSSGSGDGAATPSPTPTETAASVPTATYVVQFASPDGAAFDAALGSVRGTPGVGAASVSSTAIGGISVMRVTYTGDLSALAAALRARGWNVTQGPSALSITR
ncbi:heavy-metal-associated domain-containing protein [Alteriqipengyuania sp. WL0013]|uniref:heavy-metal-associated domain-containing protein n=1 Tax=Alteriqipengyuania sp. WL0013 TaxID=3110773 RepID=UPI002BEB983D|nr:heavy-metal-associated domain-containing protein [Alteriqipengyuania sp. WL0013]MEB3415649.1 heavy-metal-associated domain-containing protein [Alteriqipengyuania sp. WL0013]